jgi:ubiquitin carboxyl-terminal hydrolase 5/13
LVIQLKKFCLGEDWTPKKLDVAVEMPLDLDLSVLKAKGPQPEDIEFPPDAVNNEEPPQPKVTIDESVVTQLMEMGFHSNACRKAVIATGNSGAETAMNWIITHMDDPDLNDPISSQPGGGGNSNFVPNEEALLSIQSMGFTPAQAKKALQNTDNNVERAVDWIFSHADELNSITDNTQNSNCVQQMDVAAEDPKAGVTDGPASEYNQSIILFYEFSLKVNFAISEYKLMGFVSHMGPSAAVGHYVAHIWKDNCWVLFNDSRVAASETLPNDLGYLYFYRRT